MQMLEGVATVQPSTTSQVVQMQGSGVAKIMAEYIWVGQSGADLKSRTVVLDEKPSCADELPIAEIDGSSYGQAAESCCEIYLQPKKIFPDPFRGGDHILVLCDTYVPPLGCLPGADPWENMQPHPCNHRTASETVMQQASFCAPMFTMQQEYTITAEGFNPMATINGGGATAVPIKNAAATTEKATARLGREVSELHMQACLAAGLSYNNSGSTSYGSQQWSYKIGPCRGIDAADQLSISRFLLGRVAEFSEAGLAYDSPCSPGAASSNKCIVQFSTASSRDPVSGLSAVQEMMERLHACHAQPLVSHAAGSGSNKSSGSWHSASGAFSETAAAAGASGAAACATQQFTVGVANKHASIMVPTSTLINKCGPILDRRPPASSDPYLTTMLLVSAACGLPLPPATVCAMQLAATLQHIMLTRAGCGGSAGTVPGALPIPSSGRPASHSYDSLGSASFGSAAPSSLSGMSASMDSQDVLLSALDKLDGWTGSSALVAGAAGSGGCYSSCYSDICSDASSPLTHNALAAAAGAPDHDMFYE